MKTWLAATAIALVLAAAPTLAQTVEDTNASIEAVLGDPAPYAEAFEAVKAAIAADDAEALAALISYPFRVTADGEDYRFDGPEGVVEHYDQIVTDEIRQAVEEQTYETLFVNQQGVMFGNGQVWLNGICADSACEAVDVRIVTIQSTVTE